MGQAKRRKAEIRKLKIPIVAIHEAGHAVARFLTAEMMGYEPAEAVWKIVMDSGPVRKAAGSDGQTHLYQIQATTYGYTWSKEIEDASREVNARYGIERIQTRYHEYRADVIAAARAAGADIGQWARAVIFITIAGPRGRGNGERAVLRRPLVHARVRG
jgi:hypothetical protein